MSGDERQSGELHIENPTGKDCHPGEERGRDGTQPLSRSIECHNKVVAISFELLGEHEYALLAGKTDFFYLSVFAQQHCVVVRLLVAIFPSAFRLRDLVFAMLYGNFVAIDGEAVFARLKCDLADFGRLRDVDRLDERLCEYGNGEAKHAEKRGGANERIGLHRCSSFHTESSQRNGRRVRARGVDTPMPRRVDSPSDTVSSWTNRRKDLRVIRPAAATAGFFTASLNSTPEPAAS